MPEPEPTTVRLSEEEEAYFRKRETNRREWERERSVPARIQWIVFIAANAWMAFVFVVGRAIGMNPWVMMAVIWAGILPLYRWRQSHRRP